MTVGGFTFVRNGVTYDYPFTESLRSLLPLCDEVVVAVGQSTDDTLARVRAIDSPKIRILQTLWDDALRAHGAVLAEQTNLALDQVKSDWGIYLQADEVLHEDDTATIIEAMRRYRDDPAVEGLLFRYVHFYGSYHFVGASRKWYRREVRIVRPGRGVRSWGDAQGFRREGRKLRVKLIPATIYHYGWVKPPAVQQLKQRHFNRLWHPDDWVESHVGDVAEYDYASGGRLRLFSGRHPEVMRRRVAEMNWKFSYDPARVQQPWGERLLDSIEDVTGWRIGEYRNYRII